MPRLEQAGGHLGGGTQIVGRIGQAFDGTVAPLATGFVISGAVTLVLLLIAERGRLCKPLEGRDVSDPNA